MKRDPNLVCLSREHHDGLVMCLRIERDLAQSDLAALASLHRDLDAFWEQSLLRHFRAESECLLARLIRHVAVDDPLTERLSSDHLVLAGMIADMRDSPEQRPAVIREFGAFLRSHIKWEEEQLFEVSQRLLARREMQAVGRELDARLPPVCFPDLWGPSGPPNKKSAADSPPDTGDE